MDEDSRREFEAQGAQLMAIETVLFALLSELQRIRRLGDRSLHNVFDQAEDTITAAATAKNASQAPQGYHAKALKIVTEIRAQLGLGKA